MECKHAEFDGGGYCVDCRRGVYSSLRFEQAENRRLREWQAEARELLGVLEYRPDDWSFVATIDAVEWLCRCKALLGEE